MDRLRTFGIVAHIDAGKTTLTERILYDAGAKERAGSVDDGTASTDWLPEERSRGISIEAAATRVAWGGCELQVVDTPGHVDFVAEVERCLWVMDGVVVVVDATRGVESQTRTVWAQAQARGLPRLVFLNKLDRAGANFTAAVKDLVEQFEVAAAPLVVPVLRPDGTFAGLVHALHGTAQWFVDSPDAVDRRLAVEAMRAAHERLLELAADADEAILAAVVDGVRIEPAAVLAALRRECHAGRLVPVFAGAALLDRGVDLLLDGVVDWLPPLTERARTGMWATARAGDPAAPFAGLVFKIDHRGEVWNFVRVVRGLLRPGDAVERQRGGRAVTVGAIGIVQADRRRDVQVIGPGEIAVLVGELGLKTGDVLGAPGAAVHVPPPRFPEPVLTAALEPARAEDAPALLACLRALAADDPTLRVDHRGGRITVRGMGELHLEIVADRLRHRGAAPFVLGKPEVEHRATVRRDGRAEVELRTLVEGREQRVRCAVAVRPEPGAMPAVLAGLAECPAASESLAAEIRFGLPDGALVGAEVALLAVDDAGTRPSEALVAAAAARALVEALAEAGVHGEEPEVEVEVWCPEEGLQPVLADLGAREAVVSGVAGGRLGARVVGRAPLRRMLGYVTKLRSMTKGLGRASMQPAGWRKVVVDGGG